MLVNLKCTIELDGLNDIQMQSVKNTIQESGIESCVRSDVIFIEADIDDSDGFSRSLATYLSEALPQDTQTIMTVKSLDGVTIAGDLIDGYYDIVIENSKVYTVPYIATRSLDKTLYEEVV